MLTAIILLGGLGFVVSVVLAIVYTKRAGTSPAPTLKQVLDSLPGANCGACGFPACEGYADALVDGKMNIGECPAGGKGLADKLSGIFGTQAKTCGYPMVQFEVEPQLPILICRGDNTHTYERFNYVGIDSCLAADIMAKGPKSCTYGCLGFGDCVAVCKFDAIRMSDEDLPIIDARKCNGCGTCIEVCPRKVLKLASKEQKIYVGCDSPESAEVTKLNCRIGCIGCGLCEKSCPYEAIKVENGRARIKFGLCQNCAICVYKCPTTAIVDKLKSRPRAMIGTNCTGCEKCREVCPMEAIDGKANEQHKVIFNKCIGCGLCHKNCGAQAIIMAFSLGYVEV